MNKYLAGVMLIAFIIIIGGYSIMLNLFGWYFFVLLMGGINVYIYRIKNRRHLLIFSHCYCESCGEELSKFDANLPLINYLALRGRARCCGAKISILHPLTEIVGGTLMYIFLPSFLF
ncbi:prepilin peptidase [Patescibacteria group bacterium]|nr:prepilin peptidase [Patescibacteria group bacterium]